MAQSIAQHVQEAENGQAGERVRVRFDVVVTDPQVLWHAAARLALRQPGMTMADVEDVLGPAEDPMLAECLAMLTAPDAIPGCMPLDFTVAPGRHSTRAQHREPTMQPLAMRELVIASGTATKQ